jgi:hypothetical protein|nr:MAG TPA: hypothetical protein [Caudoviricetes sp.]
MKYNALKKLFSIVGHGIEDRCIQEINGRRVLDIKFQTGGTASTERNGIFIEDLLIIAQAKLSEYNKQLPCRENQLAMDKIDEAILWLTYRKTEREHRGVYGTEKE